MFVFKMARANLITKFQSCLIMKKKGFFEKLNNKALFSPTVEICIYEFWRKFGGIDIFFFCRN